MKSYVKTKWVDGTTPVNAANLNKIEKGISDIAAVALSPSDIKQGAGISIETSGGGVTISANKDVMLSTSIVGIEMVSELPSEFKQNVIYYVVSESTRKLSGIYINGVCIYEVVA